jgi:hypothetical protein
MASGITVSTLQGSGAGSAPGQPSVVVVQVPGPAGGSISPVQLEQMPRPASAPAGSLGYAGSEAAALQLQQHHQQQQEMQQQIQQQQLQHQADAAQLVEAKSQIRCAAEQRQREGVLVRAHFSLAWLTWNASLPGSSSADCAPVPSAPVLLHLAVDCAPGLTYR